MRADEILVEASVQHATKLCSFLPPPSELKSSKMELISI